MAKYTEKDAARETGSTNKEVAKSYHKARDDSGARSGKDKGHFRSEPGWAKGAKTNSGFSLFPKRKK